MWLGIGELILVGCLAVITLTLAVFGARPWRWAALALCGVLVASFVSPADLASTLLIAAALCLFFLGGVRLGRRRALVASQ